MSLQFISRVKASALHLVATIVLSLCAAVLVFALWYPSPFQELSGGREIFLIVVFADVICGPLLTFVVFNKQKSKVELWRDLAVIAFIQLVALSFGLHTVWQARPLFFVHEVDRFKVIAGPALDPAELRALHKNLLPHWWHGPTTVATRAPVSVEERQSVMFESIQGGRDFGERPNFYVAYEGEAAAKAAERARPLTQFLQKHPAQLSAAQKIAENKKVDMSRLLHAPIIAREDWIVVLDLTGQVQGFLKGDGF